MFTIRDNLFLSNILNLPAIPQVLSSGVISCLQKARKNAAKAA